MTGLTANDLQRYDRQIMIEEIGEKGQEKLKNSRIFIAGAGGLGAPISLYLAAAGVGTIRIVDKDKIDISNLNRQVLYGDKDIGRKKVDACMEKLTGLNQTIHIETISETITDKNTSQLVRNFDLIVDALDNFPARYLLNKAAIEASLPFFHGAVNGFEGRVTTIIPGQSACLKCMYRGPIPKEKFPVIGVTPAVIGAIQATEVIKYITGTGELLINRLLVYNGLNMSFTEFEIKKNPNCDHCSVS